MLFYKLLCKNGK